MTLRDWLRKQHERSERNKALFENRGVPTHEMVAANRAWGGGPGSGSGYQDRPGGQRLMVRQPIRRPTPPPASVTVTEKNDGTTQKVTKWTPEKQLKATALPDSGRPLSGIPVIPSRITPGGGLPMDISRWGGQRGQIENQVSPGMMASDPSWAGVPRPSVPPVDLPGTLKGRPGETGWQPTPQIPQPMTPTPQPEISPVTPNIPAPLSQASPEMLQQPQVSPEALQQPQIPAPLDAAATGQTQQMPPPRFVPPIDPTSFPSVRQKQFDRQDYDLGQPGIPESDMSTGFDWTGQTLKENVGDDLKDVWKAIVDRTNAYKEWKRKQREKAYGRSY